MPLPYAHFVLATAVKERANLPVADEARYLLGAFLPDIRYFTGQPRGETHFPVAQLDRHAGTDPDVLLGYRVHLLIDEVWEEPEVKCAYRRAFLPGLRARMTRGLEALAFELYCLGRPLPAVRLEPLATPLTRQLGVSPAALERAVRSGNRYLERHDLAAALEMARETGLFPAHRVATLSRVTAALRLPGLGFALRLEVARASRPTFKRVVRRVGERLDLG